MHVLKFADKASLAGQYDMLEFDTVQIPSGLPLQGAMIGWCITPSTSCILTASTPARRR
jgi:hypothetical protein